MMTFKDMTYAAETVEIFGWNQTMNKKTIKHYRIIKTNVSPEKVDSKKEENKELIPQIQDYVSYYELFKSLEN